MPREGKGAGLALVLRDKQEETAPAGGQAACEGQKCEKIQQHTGRPSVKRLPTLGEKEDHSLGPLPHRQGGQAKVPEWGQHSEAAGCEVRVRTSRLWRLVELMGQLPGRGGLKEAEGVWGFTNLRLES